MNNVLIFWDFDPNLFYIPYFNVSVTWYGALFGTGYFIACYLFEYFIKRSKETQSNLKGYLGFMYTIEIVSLICFLLGARIGQILLYDPSFYISCPSKCISVWEGGLCGQTGIALGMLSLVLVYRYKFSHLNIFLILDLLSISVIPWAVLVRIGNFINQEVAGTITFKWPAVLFSAPHLSDGPRHPVQLYEALAYTIIFLIAINKKHKWGVINGRTFAIIDISISLCRFFLEGIKDDMESAQFYYIHVAKIMALLYTLMGMLVLHIVENKSSR